MKLNWRYSFKDWVGVEWKKKREGYYIYAPPWGLSIQAKEFSVAACIMQSSSKELSTLVADRVQKCKQMDAATAAAATAAAAAT